MRDRIVAVDLETTGLDPAYDRIIEVGAVKYQGDELLGELQILVNPGFAIPPYVTRLTGIRNEDVESAPIFASVLPEVRHFIGDSFLLGHNIRFDLAFLHAEGLPLRNAAIDTYSVASALLPNTPRYSLSALASVLSIPTEGAHRALNDARMTHGIYRKLWAHVFELPLDTLAEIVKAGKHVPWDGFVFFEAALQERSRGVLFKAETHDASQIDEEIKRLFATPQESIAVLRPCRTTRSLDLDALAALVEPEGKLAEGFKDYEYRSQQVEMLRAVGEAFNDGKHILIEAPTGVGKSLAYLIPAAYFAVTNNDRVVISTNTINLQDQLISKDIPLLQSALDLPLRVAVLKGRNNYLCLRKLATLRQRGPVSSEEMQMLARLLIWLNDGASGERGDITLRGPVEAAIWEQISAGGEGCTLDRCKRQMDGRCPFYHARHAAETAHLLIVNHALLLSDVVTEGRILPDYRYLIVDEAHHLEEATTNGLSFRTDPRAIRRQIAELGTSTTGLLGEVLRRCRGSIPSEHFSTLESFINTVADATSVMAQHSNWFFGTLRQFIEEHIHIPRNEYTQQIRILNHLRSQPAWGRVEVHWDNLSQFTSTITEAMIRLGKGLQDLAEFDIEEYDDLVAGVGAASRHLNQLHTRLGEMVNEPDPNTIYWVEFQLGNDDISLHTAPLDVGPLVEKHLWNTKDTIVGTSATLRTDNSFAFIRDRLKADRVEEVLIDTPFDYKNSTLLYIINDIPEPGQMGAYQKSVEQGLIELCQATEGRTLALFTSYAQLQETSNAICDALAQDDIVVYAQSDGTSRAQLLEGFVQSKKAVLLGTSAFWEGVDVPGEDLSVLAIIRLPFNVPSDPLFAARSEQFDNPFLQYAVPESILRFRQGFGRLIRRKDDRGIVVIFDRRVISKRYGQLFIDSLPQCTVKAGRLADLPESAITWLRGNRSDCCTKHETGPY